MELHFDNIKQCVKFQTPDALFDDVKIYTILYCQNEALCKISGQTELFNPVFEKHGILLTSHIIDVIFPPDMSLGPQYFLHTFLWHHPFIMQNFRTIKALHHYIFSNKVAVVCPLRCIRVSIFLDACPIKVYKLTAVLLILTIFGG